jgi:RNase P subunit RPR2
MIEKLYKVTCDQCGIAMNHYSGRKPDNKELSSDGFIVTATKQFCCQGCYDEWLSKRSGTSASKSVRNGEENNLPNSTQRELCKNCYNWLTQEDVGPHDFPHCQETNRYACLDYLYHRRNDCPEHIVQ